MTNILEQFKMYKKFKFSQVFFLTYLNNMIMFNLLIY